MIITKDILKPIVAGFPILSMREVIVLVFNDTKPTHGELISLGCAMRKLRYKVYKTLINDRIEKIYFLGNETDNIVEMNACIKELKQA